MRAARWSLWGLCALAGLGCASSAARLQKAQQDNQRYTQELEATKRSVESITAYLADLRSPGASGPSFSLYHSPAALEQLAGQMLPLRMAARSFHPQLQGDVVIDRLFDVHFNERNTVTCQVLMHGENIRYTGSVPKMYAAEVRKFQSGVAAGVVANVVVELSLGADHALVARARATRTKLKAHSNAGAENTLRDEMNGRVLRTPFRFDLSLQGSTAVPSRMALTANHLVVTYTP